MNRMLSVAVLLLFTAGCACGEDEERARRSLYARNTCWTFLSPGMDPVQIDNPSDVWRSLFGSEYRILTRDGTFLALSGDNTTVIQRSCPEPVQGNEKEKENTP